MAKPKEETKKKPPVEKKPKEVVAMVPVELGGLTIPDPVETKKRFQQYLALKDAITDDEDYVFFVMRPGERGDTIVFGSEGSRGKKSCESKVKLIKGGYIKKRIKKSGVYKIGTVFGIDAPIIEETKETNERFVAYHFKVRAVHKASGRFAEAVGSASSNERGKGSQRPIHDPRSTAETRASERAIMKLVGFGELTAEEAGMEEVVVLDKNGKEVKPTSEQVKVPNVQPTPLRMKPQRSESTKPEEKEDEVFKENSIKNGAIKEARAELRALLLKLGVTKMLQSAWLKEAGYDLKKLNADLAEIEKAKEYVNTALIDKKKKESSQEDVTTEDEVSSPSETSIEEVQAVFEKLHYAPDVIADILDDQFSKKTLEELTPEERNVLKKDLESEMS